MVDTEQRLRHANWKPLLFRWGVRLNSSPLVIGAIKTIKGLSLVVISIRVTHDAYVKPIKIYCISLVVDDGQVLSLYGPHFKSPSESNRLLLTHLKSSTYDCVLHLNAYLNQAAFS
ncbi:hypothetical protein BCR42DRAFT_435475 [Absidia repens]|uniref:Uncharacterized protein n=1 Tax=Absidia repens TaxID=90262 RepID=A0A1X2IQ37_9FUNG|nr:hypothetical protein BCR42DRAFT_435475 [Absidia repens]